MRDQVHYYSANDGSIPFELNKAMGVIEKYKVGCRPEDVNDVIELYNILLFVENEVYRRDWSEETLEMVRTEFKDEIVRFFAGLNRETWVSVFKQVDIEYAHCFWEILSRFNYAKLLDLDTLRDAFSERPWQLREFLRQERLVNQHPGAVAELLKENEHAAEWLLQEYVEYDDAYNHKTMFFPQALTIRDREEIISRYLDSERPNLNYVRLVLLARKDANLRFSDDLRLKARNVEQHLEEELFTSETVFEHRYGVRISKVPGKPMKWVEWDENGNPTLCYSWQFILQFKGPDLMHYLRYGFEFLTPNGLITLISKSSDTNSVERVFSMRGKYAYPTNFSFQYFERISLTQIEAMQCVLQDEGTNIEGALKAFYEQYLKEKFGYPSGMLSLADVSSDWLTKCKAIAPEIDAIAHRYDLYAKTGGVNDDLLMISTDNVRITEVRSANPGRYYTIKGQPDELRRLFYIFFSEQSMLTFVEPFKEDHYQTFYELLQKQDGIISYDSYEEYQRQDIDYLIDKGYLSIGTDGKLYVEKMREINLIRQLYEYHACPAQLYGPFEKGILEDMELKGWLEKDNHLLTKDERNYFDYYMYNTQYTNAPALRNRYAHGSHAAPSKENIHRNAYNRLLILLILELLKIEDDLIIQQLSKKDPIQTSSAIRMISSVAEVGSFTSMRSNPSGRDYLTLPKKYGLSEGYVHMNDTNPDESFAYYIKPGDSVSAEYLAFLLNASLIRLSIVRDYQAPVNLTVERIGSLLLPIIPLSEQRIFAHLEHLLSRLVAKGGSRNHDEELQYNVFSSLRDYLCLQLLRPDFTREHKLDFITPYKEIIVRLEAQGTQEKNSSIALFQEIAIPGSPLLEAMKNARSILDNSSSGEDVAQ